jgi:glutamate-1-semialdehyde 2,1-aminomutase
MTVVAVVQARMGSSRLPGKVLRKIGGTPMIGLLLRRLSQARRVDKIVVATSENPNNASLVQYVEGIGIACETGSENDVLDRYLKVARRHKADVVVRITGDCPLVDPVLVDEVIGRFEAANVDYFSNTAPPTYPDGLDTEVFTIGALERAASETNAPYDREHVTPYLKREDLFRQGQMQGDEDLSALRWTVDELADFEVIKRVFEHFAPRLDFSWKEVLELQRNASALFVENQDIKRNEGSVMGKGQKLWKRAKTVIPGGNMFLSKRAEMHLPEKWPAYFSRAKGCEVWDMDGNRYIDMSLMGVGTNTLGYGDAEVDAVVHQTVDAGNMSTLNCPEEVYLAERLVEIHPWADMVRLARTGGEANAIAIRIARAASGRDNVAICGYHGWHDWYLSANLGDNERLAGHHLPGLDPKGVPQNLRGSVFPFNYNDYAALEALVATQNIGVIKMEVMRNMPPEDRFLERVRALATARNIVLMFDECTSGFRETFGGLHKKYGVEPDMAVFGKAIGNGYAITAVIGRRDIMEAAQTTFISSSFWSERIGPAAAVKTLEVMERERSWETITRVGLEVRKRWQSMADRHGLKLDHWGIPALAGFTVKSANALAYKTLITQEMLAKGYLAGNSVYACTAHTTEIVDAYFSALDPVFGLIRECEDGRDVMSLLHSPVCHGGFKRLN